VTPFREQIRNLWVEDPVAVHNATGNSIPAFRFLTPVGVQNQTAPDLPIPQVEVLSSTTLQKPIAFSLNEIPNGANTNSNSLLRAIQRGVVQVTNFDTTSATPGDKVYCNNSGQISLSPSPLWIGHVLVSSPNGVVYIDTSWSEGGGGSGESNDAANVGSGAGLFRDKTV
jgi:hypothetical protein